MFNRGRQMTNQAAKLLCYTLIHLAVGVSCFAASGDEYPVDVRILAGPQYVLVAPTDGKLVQAPSPGRIHTPAASISNTAELNALKKKWDESGDPDAVAIF